MKSPFKFLDSFTLADREVFFGRDQEIEELYELTFKARLILIYGNSGTGKTSLIQCGLASKFDGPDWFPFWIRKNGNINNSLRIALRKALKSSTEIGSLVEAVSELFNYYLRPVFLIFDQFEELFILGSYEERQQFVQEIQDLFEMELPCKILFVMREEYLGNLYEFEKTITAIFDHRIRIEPMNAVKTKEVLRSSFEKFNIRLEGDPEERLEEMIDNISGERSGIQLPYLQVYLDMMYRDSYRRQYQSSEAPVELPVLNFTKRQIEDTGTIENVLEKFLLEQEKDLQLELEQSYPNLPANTVQNILDGFVTEEGTKRPVYYRWEGEQIQLSEHLTKIFPAIPPPSLSDSLIALEERRLLRFSEDSIELAHDSLAELINGHRTEEQRQLNQYRRIINNAYEAHQQFGGYLSAPQLLGLTNVVSKLGLDDQQQQFFEESRERVKEQQEKLAKDLLAQKAKNRVIGIALLVSLTLAVLAVSLFFAVKEQRDVAEDKERIANDLAEKEKTLADSLKRTTFNYFLQNGKNLLEMDSFTLSIPEFELALPYAKDSADSNLVQSLLQQAQRGQVASIDFDQYLIEGNQARRKGQFEQAYQAYLKAKALGIKSAKVDRLLAQLQNEVFNTIKELVQNAEDQLKANYCQNALDQINPAKAWKGIVSSTKDYRTSDIEPRIQRILSACQ